VIGEIKFAYEWLWDAFSLSESDAIRLIAKEKLLTKTYRKSRRKRAKVDSCNLRNSNHIDNLLPQLHSMSKADAKTRSK
jgi:hypothetical protein